MRRIIGGISVVTLALAGLTLGGGGAGAANDRSPLPWTRPAWVGAASAAAPSVAPVTVRVYLRWRDGAGAAGAATAVSDPADARYHHYLSPTQVRARFGPTTAAETRVRQWLGAAGLVVGDVPPNALYVPATGTTAQVSRAFSTAIADYTYRGRHLHAATSTPSAPAAVAADVAGVSGLDSTVSRKHPNHAPTASTCRGAAAPAAGTGGGAGPAVAPPSPGFRNAPPCSKYWAQKLDTVDPAYNGAPNPMPYVPCGLVPSQLRAAYGIDHAVGDGNDGRGVRVAVVDAYASPTARADLRRYARTYDPTHPLAAGQYSERVFPVTDPRTESPDVCDASGWYGEQTLDLEAVHAMAPGASLLYVGAASCFDDDLDVALNDIVAHHRADIVTNSYSDSGEDVSSAEYAAFDKIAVSAALEGIGLYFSSGDDGDEAAVLGHPAPDFSATSPLVTAVGGTSLGVDARGHTVIERGWETGIASRTAHHWDTPYPGAFLYGSGGGVSRHYAEPDYQRAVVPDALAKVGNTRGRVLPDIAVDGDPNTGMLVGQTQTFGNGVYFDVYRIGGTSLSSPLFAGIMALADQRSGYAHGFANPALYRLYRSGAFTDVTPGGPVAMARVSYANDENAHDGLFTSARTLDDPKLTIHTAVGYDTVTGMGTPWGPTFLLLLGAR